LAAFLNAAARGAVVLAVALGVTACAAVQTGAPREELALLEVDCQPADAEVWVDDHYLGKITEWRGGIVPLPPGEHRVMITADGYRAYRRDLSAKSGRSYRLALDLVPDLDTEDVALEEDR
jgi:hypothetical protein